MTDIGIPGYDDADLLGQGGFGVVYKCRQVALNRTVAVKIFRSTDGSMPFETFERECAAIGQLDWCPQIVTVFSTGQTKFGEPYIVMEYAPGGSLAGHLGVHGSMDESAARRIGLHIATALATAHDAGILHRDVKPGNVLISRSGDPVLADFGIARLVGGTATATGLVSGTIAYSAPEVLEGRGATAQSDIYSLGAMLFAALAGHPPYVLGSGEAMAAVISRTLIGPPPDTQGLPVSSGFADVLARCLDREPARRFASAHDVATALESTIARQSTAPETRTVARSALREWPSAFYYVTPTSTGSSRPTGRQWPTATDYVEAIQARPNPVQAAQFGGARIVRDSLGMPASASGQNAVVFELSDRTGPLALRCFTRDPVDGETRYRELGAFLAEHHLPSVTPSVWVDEAIAASGGTWPAVVMPWVPGVPLNLAVEGMLERPETLRQLAEALVSVVGDLYRSGAAHGDLQCGNILVDQDGVVRLVDMDGFFVPAMTKAPGEIGHPHFQHPRRTAAHWGADADAFSLLVIYTSLLALADNPQLWRFNTGENLILGREDYLRPEATPAWHTLTATSNPRLAGLTRALADYCRADVPPGLHDVLLRIRPALAEAREADLRSGSGPLTQLGKPTPSPVGGPLATEISGSVTPTDEAGDAWWDSGPAPSDWWESSPEESPTVLKTTRTPGLADLPRSDGAVTERVDVAATRRTTGLAPGLAAASGAVASGTAANARRGLATIMGGNAVGAGMTAGLLAGALALAVQAAIGPGLPLQFRSLLFLVLVGSLLAASLGGVGAATMGAWKAARNRALTGVIEGALLSLIALEIFQLSMVMREVPLGPVPFPVLAVVWALSGAAIGLATGLARRSVRAALSGLAGGVMGGLVGAVAHRASAPTLETNAEYDGTVLAIHPTDPLTIAGVLGACVAIGLAIGLVDRLRRHCWLTVIEGPMRGREVILDDGTGTIGSSRTCTLRLPEGNGVLEQHASLINESGRHRLEVVGALELNGNFIDDFEPRPLVSGDVLRIGGCFIRFDVKDGGR